MSATVTNYRYNAENSRAFGYEEAKAISKSMDTNYNNRIDKSEAYFKDGTIKKVDSNYYETERTTVGTNDMANAIYNNKIEVKYLNRDAALKVANFFDNNYDGYISKNELNLRGAFSVADGNGGGRVSVSELASKLVNGDLVINGSHIAVNPDRPVNDYNYDNNNYNNNNHYNNNNNYNNNNHYNNNNNYNNNNHYNNNNNYNNNNHYNNNNNYNNYDNHYMTDEEAAVGAAVVVGVGAALIGAAIIDGINHK